LKVVQVFPVIKLSLVTLQHRKGKQGNKNKLTEERRDIEKEKNERQGVMTHILKIENKRQKSKKMKGRSTEKKKRKGQREVMSEKKKYQITTNTQRIKD